MTIITPGTAAPEFSLQREDGGRFTNADLAGKTVVLVFYPNAFSPVCTDQFQVYQEALGDITSDGAEIYGSQRIPKGGAFTASPWAYNGKLFCINEDGATSVLKAGPTFEVLHTNSLGPDEMCLATPAIADNKLLIRTVARLYCITNKSPQR